MNGPQPKCRREVAAEGELGCRSFIGDKVEMKDVALYGQHGGTFSFALSEQEAYALLDLSICSARELDQHSANALKKLADFCRRHGSSLIGEKEQV